MDAVGKAVIQQNTGMTDEQNLHVLTGGIEGGTYTASVVTVKIRNQLKQNDFHCRKAIARA